MVDVFDFSSVGEGSAELLIAKLALFFLTLILVNFVLRKTLDIDTVLNAIISISVSILAVASIETKMVVDYFLTGYGLFGIITITLLPFFLFFFFVESFDFPLLRKGGLFLIGMFYLWIGYSEIGMFSLGSYWTQDIAWLHFSIAAIAFFIVVFEKSVRKFVFHRK